MKKLMFALLASAAMLSYADAQKDESKELEKQEAPLFWGFGNYGLYSGYQLYGSLLNNEPTLQGYVEGNINLPGGFGYVGLGLWSNSDLTNRRRSGGLGQMFNEWDPNVHFGYTFWFDEDEAWGLDWRSSVVWYYYPAQDYKEMHPATDTTWDFDHSFALLNPYLIPYVNIVREYRFDANLFQFGIRKPIQITDDLSICPFIEMVARDSHYNWCFPTRFGAIDTCGGLATLKVELDATYKITENFGLFAKVAYCSIIDHNMRNSCDDILASDEYGENKDFAWGGVGVTFNF